MRGTGKCDWGTVGDETTSIDVETTKYLQDIFLRTLLIIKF